MNQDVENKDALLKELINEGSAIKLEGRFVDVDDIQSGSEAACSGMCESGSCMMG
jgi:hypothetical protein